MTSEEVASAYIQRNAELENLYTTCREDWRYLMRRIDALAEDAATGSRDFGRGYMLALKDVKKEMSRLERLTTPKAWSLSDEVLMGLHDEPHP